MTVDSGRSWFWGGKEEMSVNKKSQVPRSDWKWQIGAVRPKRGGGGLGNSQRAARCWLPPTTTVRWCFGGDGGRLRRSGRGCTLGWLAERQPKNGSRVSAAWVRGGPSTFTLHLVGAGQQQQHLCTGSLGAWLAWESALGWVLVAGRNLPPGNGVCLGTGYVR